MLRSWRVRGHPGSSPGEALLAKVAGSAGRWDAGAVLCVGDSDSFEATVAFDTVDTPTFVLGVAQAAALADIADDEEDLLSALARRSPECCFLQVLSTSGYPLVCRREGRPAFIDNFGAVAAAVTVRYSSGQVSFSSGHHTFGPHAVPSTEYRPCILLCTLGVAVTVACRRKRWRLGSHFEGPPQKAPSLSCAKRARASDAESTDYLGDLGETSPALSMMSSLSYRSI